MKNSLSPNSTKNKKRLRVRRRKLSMETWLSTLKMFLVRVNLKKKQRARKKETRVNWINPCPHTHHSTFKGPMTLKTSNSPHTLTK